MYLETMERLFSGTDKIILDSGTASGGQGVVPYLSARSEPAAAAASRRRNSRKRNNSRKLSSAARGETS